MLQVVTNMVCHQLRHWNRWRAGDSGCVQVLRAIRQWRCYIGLPLWLSAFTAGAVAAAVVVSHAVFSVAVVVFFGTGSAAVYVFSVHVAVGIVVFVGVVVPGAAVVLDFVDVVVSIVDGDDGVVVFPAVTVASAVRVGPQSSCVTPSQRVSTFFGKACVFCSLIPKDRVDSRSWLVFFRRPPCGATITADGCCLHHRREVLLCLGLLSPGL